MRTKLFFQFLLNRLNLNWKHLTWLFALKIKPSQMLYLNSSDKRVKCKLLWLKFLAEGIFCRELSHLIENWTKNWFLYLWITMLKKKIKSNALHGDAFVRCGDQRRKVMMKLYLLYRLKILAANNLIRWLNLCWKIKIFSDLIR